MGFTSVKLCFIRNESNATVAFPFTAVFQYAMLVLRECIYISWGGEPGGGGVINDIHSKLMSACDWVEFELSINCIIKLFM